MFVCAVRVKVCVCECGGAYAGACASYHAARPRDSAVRPRRAHRRRRTRAAASRRCGVPPPPARAAPGRRPAVPVASVVLVAPTVRGTPCACVARLSGGGGDYFCGAGAGNVGVGVECRDNYYRLRRRGQLTVSTAVVSRRAQSPSLQTHQ
jgi:hypothetical protein